MSKNYKSRRQVYAVIRIDGFLSDDTPLEHRVVVKEIVSSLEPAQAEVQRLDELSSDQRMAYFWQTTRLYPDGLAAGAQTEPD